MRVSNPPQRRDLMIDLVHAVARGDLGLHYQPMVATDSGAVVGVEALVRWRHPTWGTVAPASFVPMAERTTLIGPMTQHVLRAALEQARAWRDTGLDLDVAVNISARNLQDRGLPEAVARLLDEHGIAPSSLTLEITETAPLVDGARTRTVLTSLRAVGVRLALDDVGIGYSSPIDLQRLPIDVVKIGAPVMRRTIGDPHRAAVVGAVVALAHDLGITVVAEGVEDTATWRAASRAGCDVVQGYAVCIPLPGSALRTWIESGAQPAIAPLVAVSA